MNIEIGMEDKGQEQEIEYMECGWRTRDKKHEIWNENRGLGTMNKDRGLRTRNK